MGTETMWKIVGLAMTIGSTIGGLVGFLIHLMLRVKP
jgi:preprotein translocase subunit Sss1